MPSETEWGHGEEHLTCSQFFRNPSCFVMNTDGRGHRVKPSTHEDGPVLLEVETRQWLEPERAQ